jgi:hypothetical protein
MSGSRSPQKTSGRALVERVALIAGMQAARRHNASPAAALLTMPDEILQRIIAYCPRLEPRLCCKKLAAVSLSPATLAILNDIKTHSRLLRTAILRADSQSCDLTDASFAFGHSPLTDYFIDTRRECKWTAEQAKEYLREAAAMVVEIGTAWDMSTMEDLLCKVCLSTDNYAHRVTICSPPSEHAYATISHNRQAHDDPCLVFALVYSDLFSAEDIKTTEQLGRRGFLCPGIGAEFAISEMHSKVLCNVKLNAKRILNYR